MRLGGYSHENSDKCFVKFLRDIPGNILVMRKPKYEFGNVGPNFREDVHRRCNCCDFLAGIDGKRQMRKDPNDKTGGYICEKCWRLEGETKDFETEEWYQKAVDAIGHSVDNDKEYDEIVEDLITDWEKSEGR